MNELDPILWIFLGALLIAQATWIFRDARLRREDYAWLRRLFGLINIPSSIIVYILVTRRNNVRCAGCSKPIPRELEICPYCGSIKAEK